MDVEQTKRGVYKKTTEQTKMERNWHLSIALMGATGRVRTHIEKAMELNSKLEKEKTDET